MRFLSSLLAVVIVAGLFVCCYGQEQQKICSNGVCRIVDFPRQVVSEKTESVVTAETVVTETRTNAVRKLRFKPLARLRGIFCRR